MSPVVSLELGASTLAEAGVLDDRRATTHWAFARELLHLYPRLKVEEDQIFIIDGSVWTSAGMTAGINPALAIVEKDIGPEVPRSVPRKLVVYHRHAGGQSQFSGLLELEPKSDRIQNAVDLARQNLPTALSVRELAEAPWQFSWAFRAERGQSPAKAAENLRMETARLLILSMDMIANEIGFADRERIRRVLGFGQPPQTMRRISRMSARPPRECRSAKKGAAGKSRSIFRFLKPHILSGPGPRQPE
jgi:transcriptional regulator GlxA family with amidase domain